MGQPGKYKDFFSFSVSASFLPTQVFSPYDSFFRKTKGKIYFEEKEEDEEVRS